MLRSDHILTRVIRVDKRFHIFVFGSRIILWFYIRWGELWWRSYLWCIQLSRFPDVTEGLWWLWSRWHTDCSGKGPNRTWRGSHGVWCNSSRTCCDSTRVWILVPWWCEWWRSSWWGFHLFIVVVIIVWLWIGYSFGRRLDVSVVIVMPVVTGRLMLYRWPDGRRSFILTIHVWLPRNLWSSIVAHL